ncbi:hypothetical protein NC652_032557 [Populus alba x Populus x berolinensis]|nr:hypothetical protein NC652_032557 [Populus alba x Populus x berolinensis]
MARWLSASSFSMSMWSIENDSNTLTWHRFIGELVCGRGWLLKTCFVEPGRPMTLVISLRARVQSNVREATARCTRAAAVGPKYMDPRKSSQLDVASRWGPFTICWFLVGPVSTQLPVNFIVVYWTVGPTNTQVLGGRERLV